MIAIMATIFAGLILALMYGCWKQNYSSAASTPEPPPPPIGVPVEIAVGAPVARPGMHSSTRVIQPAPMAFSSSSEGAIAVGSPVLALVADEAAEVQMIPVAVAQSVSPSSLSMSEAAVLSTPVQRAEAFVLSS